MVSSGRPCSVKGPTPYPSERRLAEALQQGREVPPVVHPVSTVLQRVARQGEPGVGWVSALAVVPEALCRLRLEPELGMDLGSGLELMRLLGAPVSELEEVALRH